MKILFKHGVLGVLLFSLLGSSTSRALAPEDTLYLRLVQRELIRNGIDAKVRHLLSDSQFEADLQKWWKPVNWLYVEETLEQQPIPLADGSFSLNWVQDPDNRRKVESQKKLKELFSKHLLKIIPSEKIRMYLAYFLRTQQKEKARALLAIYSADWIRFSTEISQDPRYKGMPRGSLTTDSEETLLEIRKCLTPSTSATQKGQCLAEKALGSRWNQWTHCADAYQDEDMESSLLQMKSCFATYDLGVADHWQNLEKNAYPGPAHTIGATGWIEGNQITYLTENHHDPKTIQHFESLYSGASDPVKEIIGQESEDSWEQFFRERSSFLSPPFQAMEEHPAFRNDGQVFANHRAIFPHIQRAIESARHTLFVDIFFLGGTLGMSVAQKLIDRAESGVKVFILHDEQNPFAYAEEMAPVFRLLKGYGRAHPDRLTAAGSFIYAHRTGLPEFFEHLVPGTLVNSLLQWAPFSTRQNLPLYPLAKSDHSKVLVADGAALWSDSQPVALVGSKNWTDSSGAMTFDEVAEIKGPAAVAVQDSYYWDMVYALRSGASSQGKVRDDRTLEAILAPFDPLSRRWDSNQYRSVPTVTNLHKIQKSPSNVPTYSVRIGETSVDNTLSNLVDQNILAIRSARRQIIVNDQYLYDGRIVRELLEKAKQGVAIRILLEPLSKTSNLEPQVLGGFPNNLYLDLLLYEKIQLNSQGQVVGKTRRPHVQVKWKFIPHSDEFHLEYHMKTLSIDGFDASGRPVLAPGEPGVPLLITGSANKDHMTMRGAFRETQLEIADPARTPCKGEGIEKICGPVAEADQIFWRRWNSEETSPSQRPVDGGGSVNAETAGVWSFEIPPPFQEAVKHFLDREMTSAEFLIFIRNTFDGIYGLEKDTVVE